MQSDPRPQPMSAQSSPHPKCLYPRSALSLHIILRIPSDYEVRIISRPLKLDVLHIILRNNLINALEVSIKLGHKESDDSLVDE